MDLPRALSPLGSDGVRGGGIWAGAGRGRLRASSHHKEGGDPFLSSLGSANKGSGHLDSSSSSSHAKHRSKSDAAMMAAEDRSSPEQQENNVFPSILDPGTSRPYRSMDITRAFNSAPGIQSTDNINFNGNELSTSNNAADVVGVDSFLGSGYGEPPEELWDYSGQGVGRGRSRSRSASHHEDEDDGDHDHDHDDHDSSFDFPSSVSGDDGGGGGCDLGWGDDGGGAFGEFGVMMDRGRARSQEAEACVEVEEYRDDWEGR